MPMGNRSLQWQRHVFVIRPVRFEPENRVASAFVKGFCVNSDDPSTGVSEQLSNLKCRQPARTQPGGESGPEVVQPRIRYFRPHQEVFPRPMNVSQRSINLTGVRKYVLKSAGQQLMPLQQG